MLCESKGFIIVVFSKTVNFHDAVVNVDVNAWNGFDYFVATILVKTYKKHIDIIFSMFIRKLLNIVTVNLGSG
jgi:hypothetical protein